MKRGFRIALALALALGSAACVPEAPDYAVPPGVHQAPHPGAFLAPVEQSQQASRVTQVTSVVPTQTVKVGLLLPLTGRNADLGRSMQDAATIALFDRYARMSQQSSVKVDLVPKDTGDTPEQASAAMQSAIDDGASFIIGPIFSDATQAAAPVATAKNIPVLSFSNNTAQARPGVYVFGFSPQEQTKRVVAFAVKQGHSKIAALVPDSTLGATVLAAAKETLAASGLSLAAEAHYAAQGTGVDAAITQLAPNGQPAFDALLLPEGGANLGTILRVLAQHGIKQPQVQLLGTGIWDDDTLVRRVNLDGAWLASSSPEGTAAFEARFMSTYKYNPPRVVSLSYDAVSLAVTLATSGRGFSPGALTSNAGFEGPANGMFRLRPDGQVQRGLAVMQIEGANFSVLDPPPSHF